MDVKKSSGSWSASARPRMSRRATESREAMQDSMSARQPAGRVPGGDGNVGRTQVLGLSIQCSPVTQLQRSTGSARSLKSSPSCRCCPTWQQVLWRPLVGAMHGTGRAGVARCAIHAKSEALLGIPLPILRSAAVPAALQAAIAAGQQGAAGVERRLCRRGQVK